MPTTDPEGTLRLVRQGSSLTGYYERTGSSSWVPVYTGPGSTADTRISLAVFNVPNAGSFAGQPATIAFDGFAVTADAVRC